MNLTTSITALVMMLWSVPMLSALEKPIVVGKERKGLGKRGSSLGSKGGERHRDRDEVFKKLDLNQDGALSFDEFSQAERLVLLEEEKRQKLFDFLDQNNDGKLQNQELRPRAPRWMKGLQKGLIKLDANQDGQLNFEEFSKAKFISEKPEAEQREVFAKLDKDQSGEVDTNELNSRPARPAKPDLDFKKHDTDQSGGLNYTEYSNLPFVSRFPEDRRRRNFKRMDTDADGEVSEEEISSVYRRREKRDGSDLGPRGRRGGLRENKDRSGGAKN